MRVPTLGWMRNPLDWILAELQNLQTELIAPCLCARHLQHSAEKHKPSFVRGLRPSLDSSRRSFWKCPWAFWSEQALGLSFQISFFKIFSQCYPNALNGAAQVNAENKSPVDNFGIEMRWDTALQRAHECRDRFGKEPSAKQENVESNFNANGHWNNYRCICSKNAFLLGENLFWTLWVLSWTESPGITFPSFEKQVLKFYFPLLYLTIPTVSLEKTLYDSTHPLPRKPVLSLLLLLSFASLPVWNISTCPTH